MKFIYLILAVLSLAMNMSLCAQITVKGRILSTKVRSPVSGATVRTIISNTVTITGHSGEFLINLLTAKDTLIISHIGYTEKRLFITGKSQDIRILLDTSQQLMEEVIVTTGYENKPKERATGSFVNVSNELLNRTKGLDILSRLDGITSGVLFDKRSSENVKIQIRGLYSLDEKTGAPLIVLDNFPYSGDINNINPNDVDNITILRDAAAASIWGAKAGNGVIVITSKKARFNQATQLSVTSNISITAKPGLFTLPVMNATDQADVETLLFNQGAYDLELKYSWYYSITPVVQILDKQKRGIITAEDAQLQLNTLEKRDVRNDFLKYIYRPTVLQQYSASLSAGNEKANFLLSAGYDKNLESLRGNQYHRISLRVDNILRPVKNLEVQVGIGFTRSANQANSPGGFGASAYRLQEKSLPVYMQLADGNGAHIPLNVRYGAAFTDTAGNGNFLDWKYRPLDELHDMDNQSISSAFIGSLGLSYSVTPAFSAEIKYQYQLNNTEGNNYSSLQTFAARDLINMFTQLEGTNVIYPVPKGGILDQNNLSLQSHNLRGQLNYHHIWNDTHEFSVIGGAELRSNTNKTSISRTYGYDDKLNSVPVDYLTEYPVYGLGYNARIPYTADFGQRLDRYVSLYANAGYTLSGRYLLSGSVRKDASNIFAVNANQKGRPFWSAGAGWILSREKWYSSGWLPYLKLRTTFGFSGNSNPNSSAYTILDIRPAGSNYLTGIPYAVISSSPNPTLRWEKVRTINIAGDFQLLHQRLNGTIEYYIKKSTDVLGSQIVDPTTGVAGLRTNSANVSGKGLDVQLNADLIRMPDFAWRMSAQFSHSRYKVTRYLIPEVPKGYVSDGTIIIPLPGFNPYEIVSYQWAGLDPATGDPRGILNGKISSNYDSIVNFTPIGEQVKHGSALPVYFGNILQTITWKRFSLSANITFRLGYYFRKNSINYNGLFLNNSGHNDYSKRWQRPGDEKKTNIPSLIYPNPGESRDRFYLNSSVLVEKGDHIRLEDFRLNYSVPDLPGKKSLARKVQVYLLCTALNKILWRANNAGLDPDNYSGLIPQPVISAGLSAQF